MKSIERVTEFHKSFGLPILSDPGVPGEKRSRLRVALLREELEELIQAIEAKDICESADALCDLLYVLIGAVLEFGLGDKFEALFAEVHRSNMTKSCRTLEEAEQTIRYYQEEKNTPCHYVKRGDEFLIYRDDDNKTLKSVNYSPANLAAILER